MKTEAKMIIAGTACILIFGMVSSFVIKNSNASTTPPQKQGSYACTMDAKLCPDGSYVGRIPPYCQFAACSAE